MQEDSERGRGEEEGAGNNCGEAREKQRKAWAGGESSDPPAPAKISQLRRRLRSPIGSAAQRAPRLQRSSSVCSSPAKRPIAIAIVPRQPCESASTGSRSPYALSRIHCPQKSVCSLCPESQGRLVQRNAIQPFSRDHSERQQQDLFPAEMECQGSNPCLPRRANP